jgi:NADP-dependent 3-hydroxy acid dehydrogenase YdfG
LLEKHPEDHIYATTRNLEAPGIQELKQNERVTYLQLDITDEQSLKTAAAELGKLTSSVDTIFLVAGVDRGSANPLEL